MSLGVRQCGGDGQSRRGGAAGLPGWLCRRTALHDASQNAHTETALALVEAGADVHGKANDGCGFSGCIGVSVGLPRCGGGRSGDSVVELQEWLFWLCRWTALHFASLNGHTETAMALVKAGADVHCKDNDGCGSRAASSCCWFATVRGGRCVHSGAELHESFVGCSG